jgi:hypothetical protein
MRRLVSLAAAVLAGAGVAASAQAGDINFGVTITGEVMPGVYGHVVVGNAPPPPVVYARPTVIMPPPPGVVVEPIYLHVPPEHAHHWREHCHEYHACNRPVYFVRSAEYAPGFDMERWRREHPGRGHWDHDHDHDRGHWDHDHGHHDHEDHGRGHGRDHDDRD